MTGQGSFIPKQQVSARSNRPRVRRVYILNYITYTILFGTLITGGVLLLWQIQLNNNIKKSQAQLEEEKSAFSTSQIEEVREMDEKLQIVEEMLNRHAALTDVFAALEDVTLTNVQVQDFSIKKANDISYEVTMTGIAPGFNPLLFQEEVLGNSQLFKEAVIDKITYGAVESEDGSTTGERDMVEYHLVANIPVSDIHYTAEAAAVTPVEETPLSVETVDEGEVEAVETNP